MTSDSFPKLSSIRIRGYKSFKDLQANIGSLEVVAGANGSGKTNLIEFLRFLRDGMDREIPPGIIPGGTGQVIFNSFKDEKIRWDIGLGNSKGFPLFYSGELMGPKRHLSVTNEAIL